MKKLMKWSLLLVLPLMATATVVWKVAAQDPDDYTVLLPNPYDCSTYYSCSNGVPILMPCPEGQHFNATLSVCDWPQTAGCVGEKEGAKSSVEKTVETFTTTEPGWSFDVEANFWIFKSKKTTSWPASYKKETIKVSEPCCFFGKGKEDCSDLDPCPEIE